MNRIRTVALALLAAAVPAALLAANTGSADFTRTVAIGDSITAGFVSGSLNQTYQVNSYPALIWRQAKDGAPIQQPTVAAPGIPAILELRSLSPLVIAPKSGQGVPTNLTLPRPYDNLAVPGADVHDIVATVTDNGGLHDLILRGLGTQLQQAQAVHPTFAIIWAGNNDALAAATSGRVIDGVTLTTAAAFEADYRAMVAGLVAAGTTKAVVSNIPNVTAIPFVTTLTRFVPNPATGQPVVINGQMIPLIGPDGPLVAGDRVLLTAQAELAQGKGIPAALGGSGQPLSDSVVLNVNEVATITARVAQFNAVIAAVANERGFAFVDSNATLTTLATRGINIGGVTYTSAFLTGGVFSYDGVHPNAFGYAFIANTFIESINSKYGGDIPLVNLRPFMFGGRQAAAPAGNAPFYFSPQAWNNVRWALGVPTNAEIDAAIGAGGNGDGGAVTIVKPRTLGKG